MLTECCFHDHCQRAQVIGMGDCTPRKTSREEGGRRVAGKFFNPRADVRESPRCFDRALICGSWQSCIKC